MTTKKFAQMTTKKLNALLTTASDEDRVEIEAVLAAREQATTPAETPAPEATELAPEEGVAAETVETADAEPAEATPALPKTASKGKMTDEERHALAEELKKNVNHRCQAVPFNTAEWVDGYIAGVIEEKRSNKVLYAIKTDDGRRIVKVHDSNLIRVLDETVEPERKARVKRAKDGAERVEWTPEVIADEVNKVIENVGKQIEVARYNTIDKDGNEKTETTIGRIVAIVPDKRAQRLLYRISIPAPVEGNPLATKIMHKVITGEDFKIADELDAEGAAINAKYCERREAAATRTPLTPQDRVIRCEENLKKAEERLAKAQEDLENKKKQLEDAKAELDTYLAAHAEEPAPAEPIETAEVEAAEDPESLD